MKSKHQINKLINQINNSPPTSGNRRRHLPPPAAHLRRRTPPPLVTFPANQKKRKKKKEKKINLATGGGCNPPQRPRGEIWPPSVAIFASGKPTKKKDPATFVSPANKKKIRQA
jgi:hypothetical protein